MSVTSHSVHRTPSRPADTTIAGPQSSASPAAPWRLNSGKALQQHQVCDVAPVVPTRLAPAVRAPVAPAASASAVRSGKRHHAVQYMAAVGLQLLRDAGISIRQRLAASLRKLWPFGSVQAERPAAQAKMVGKTCVVTGANSGIGYATALELAKKGAHVVLVCRNPEAGKKAVASIKAASGNSQVELVCGDLSDRDKVQDLLKRLRKLPKIDVLVNNAGILPTHPRTNQKGQALSLAVNYLGPMQLTLGLVDRLEASGQGRVVNVSSGMHRYGTVDPATLARDDFTIVGAYANAKLAKLMGMRALAARLKGRPITINDAHPGGVRTGIVRKSACKAESLLSSGLGLAAPILRTPAQGADTVVYLASSPEVVGISGGYFFNRRLAQPAAMVHDRQKQETLWRFTRKTLGGVKSVEQ